MDTRNANESICSTCFARPSGKAFFFVASCETKAFVRVWADWSKDSRFSFTRSRHKEFFSKRLYKRRLPGSSSLYAASTAGPPTQVLATPTKSFSIMLTNLGTSSHPLAALIICGCAFRFLMNIFFTSLPGQGRHEIASMMYMVRSGRAVSKRWTFVSVNHALIFSFAQSAPTSPPMSSVAALRSKIPIAAMRYWFSSFGRPCIAW
mmetsp:Transcript_6410/g.15848  ORF Transcript_6410/g.15848 Transcript_6410/m.15848 type:complete len:206 (-) Transcript_6410:2262-2879(-)